MLKTRIITATILIPCVIFGTLFLPSLAFAVISGVVFGYGLWEWSRLAGFQSVFGRTICLILMPLGICLLLAILQWSSVQLQLGRWLFQEGVPLLILIFWLIAGFSVAYYPRLEGFWKSKPMGVVAGCLVLVPSWFLLVALQHRNPWLVLYILSLIWVCDIAAYFVGKRFGKYKLAPKLSPGKTWEGVLGAYVGGLFVILVGYHYLAQDHSLFSWVMLGLITITFSIVGDLFESLFKRLRNLKDSGTLLPGHGGVLDRIDSITAAVPIFAIGFMFF
ncbi:MAG: phosphatidate cytidylyltransferase [Gammaproteobacteria bacterium]|jgi:phosphatidate cytidylyltransferase|nr:phosphatidate cytidylyltransferase [Gammaproteobacteria bacterium]